MRRREFIYTVALSSTSVWFPSATGGYFRQVLARRVCDEAFRLLESDYYSLETVTHPQRGVWTVGGIVRNRGSDTGRLADSLRQLELALPEDRWHLADFAGRPERWDFAHSAPTLWFHTFYRPRTSLQAILSLLDAPGVLIPAQQAIIRQNQPVLKPSRGVWHDHIQPLLKELTQSPFSRLGIYRIVLVPSRKEVAVDFLAYRIPDPFEEG